ncbi:PREDICTED: cytochrome P450 71A9-like, partial [Nelumbo nucifera]|uniref:Cytochrome P450 71A9-like n=1 Tax=Nelumbo nucifera TaxID=4432 RepID=A0A1U8B1A5_NELNU
MFLLLSSLALLTLLILFLISKSHKFHGSSRSRLLPPGPSGLPLIGNLHQLGKSPLHCTLHQLSRRYGPLMYLQLGCVPAVVVSSAGMAKEIFKTHDLESSGRPLPVTIQKETYNRLDLVFSPYGEYWREVRKICIIILFCTKSVQSFRFIREDEISILIQSISKSAATSNPINLSEMIFSTANSIICRMAFSKSFHRGASETSSFYEMLDERHALIRSFAFANYFPYVGWMLDSLTGLNTRLERNFQQFESFYRQTIEGHLDLKRQNPEKEDIIDTLLRMQKDKSSAIDFTLDHIKAIVTDILIAGVDTTTATLVWALTLLAKNPKVMKKAQNEVRSL